MIVMLDNGHGKETYGKRSPDGCFFEWKYTREIAKSIQESLQNIGYSCVLVTPEDDDISLFERVKRINRLCDRYGAENVLMISVHCNAAGNGSQWLNAHGWECYTSRGKTNSDRLATSLYEAAKLYLPERRLRMDYSDGDPDKEADFFIIKNSKCVSVLTENLFMDNKDEVHFLLSEKGRHAITNLHVYGIINYIKDVRK